MKDLMHAHQWKRGAEEKASTVKEIHRKARQIGPAYNKGALQYLPSAGLSDEPVKASVTRSHRRRNERKKSTKEKIMAKLDAGKAGSFKINGDVKVHRLGFGAMRITGPRVWGPPLDMAEAIRTLKRLPELGIDFIDTANSYGPEVSEQLIREALYPYDGILIATKAGLRRPGPGEWERDGRPEQLREQAIQSRARLGLEQIGLWQLHAIDPKVPRDEQFAAVKSLLDDGIIRHAGLSNISVADIEAASKLFRVATVQNRYNLIDRGSEDVLDYCEKQGIGFIPWFPLAAGRLAETGSILDVVAKTHNATPSQIALAWVLKRSPVMLPIPGTSKVAHLEENVAVVNIKLSDDEFGSLDQKGRKEYRKGLTA